MKDEMTPWDWAGGALVCAAFLAFFVTCDAFFLQEMWGWFVVPLGAPAIGAAHAAGLVSLAFMLGASRAESAYSTDPALTVGGIIDWQRSIGLWFVVGAVAHWVMSR